MRAAESTPPIARTVAALRGAVAAWRSAGESTALVPTMGALHEGHLALVDAARRACRRVVVSIFVNPTQFGPAEDLACYPRREAEDLALLAARRTDLVFMPEIAEMYPAGFLTAVHVARLTEGLCGPHRPGHFDGVATVVSKLLLQSTADVAVFGEKDWQQLQVVRRAARDLDIPVRILGVPTVREPSGLALSSRNAYLDAGQRAVAEQLNRILRDVATRVAAAPDSCNAAAAAGRARLLAAGFDRVDYLEIRDAESLERLTRLDRPARVFAAAWLGKTRLIDNVPVGP
jgi:pantoate--beta-alanine ligase